MEQRRAQGGPDRGTGAPGRFLEALAEEVARDLDPFDLLLHVAYDQPALTRRERAQRVKKRNVFTQYGPVARKVLETLLDKYADEGHRHHRERRRAARAAVHRPGYARGAGPQLRRAPQYLQALAALERELYALTSPQACQIPHRHRT